MGNEHRNEWYRALPWVLLGQRVRFQPNLDASAAQMVLQMSPRIPGQLLGDPGPPLNSAQTRALLDQLYKLSDRPSVPTSGRRVFNDISETDSATHVYVKVDKPLSLQPKWEGPYRILSRPSRSTIEVKLGVFKSGELRKQVYHWNLCKVAYLRPDSEDASRPALGRPKTRPATGSEAVSEQTDATGFVYGGCPPLSSPAPPLQSQPANDNKLSGGEIQTDRQVRRTRNPNPNYKT